MTDTFICLQHMELHSKISCDVDVCLFDRPWNSRYRPRVALRAVSSRISGGSRVVRVPIVIGVDNRLMCTLQDDTILPRFSRVLRTPIRPVVRTSRNNSLLSYWRVMCFEFRDTCLVDTFMSDNQLNMKDGACFECETFLDVVVLTDFRKLRENIVLNYGRVMCFQFRNTPSY